MFQHITLMCSTRTPAEQQHPSLQEPFHQERINKINNPKTQYVQNLLILYIFCLYQCVEFLFLIKLMVRHPALRSTALKLRLQAAAA